MKTILKNKWHLHFVVGALFLLTLMQYNSDSLGKFGKGFILLFALFWGACLWEWMQNKIFKANQSTETSKGDIIASVLGGIFGLILYFIF